VIATTLQKISHFLSGLSYRQSTILMGLLGVANVLSFAPFFIWPLQIISLVLMFVILALHSQWNKKQIAFIGLLYSFSFLYLGLSWLLVAMSRYGGVPIVLSLIGLMLFTLYLSLFSVLGFLLASYLIKRWQLSQTISLILIYPSCWVISEILRGYVFTGFPWLTSGYAHNINVLSGFAPILGVYGMSFVAALIAGFMALSLLDSKKIIRYSLCVVGLFVLGWGLQQVSWTKAQGKPLTVRLIQGNINQGIKFDGQFVQYSLDLYEAMLTKRAADLIVIPETAIPILNTQLPADYITRIKQFSEQNKSHLVLGMVMDDGNTRYANSAIGISPDQIAKEYRYDKHHLVPFGEFVPFGFRWAVDLMRIPLGEFTGKDILQAPILVKDQFVMPNICYEDLFGEEIALQIRLQVASEKAVSNVLLNMSNLAWYGDSIAIPQHLQISQMRSLETGRPMLRSTNTGATAIINEKGKIMAQIKPLTTGTLKGSVQGMQGVTPYIQFGNLIIQLMVALSIVLAYFLKVNGKNKSIY
jgi:apolipoprotein N-acyltransferase